MPANFMVCLMSLAERRLFSGTLKAIYKLGDLHPYVQHFSKRTPRKLTVTL